MKLYELAKPLQEFLNAVDAGMIPEEAIADTLEGLEIPFYEKLENCALAYKDMVGDAVKLKQEEDKLKARRTALEKKAEGLKNYMDRCLIGAAPSGKKPQPFVTERCELVYRASSAVIIFDGDAFWAYAVVHPELTTQKKPEVNKTAVKDALKAGTEVPGAKMQTSFNLQIK